MLRRFPFCVALLVLSASMAMAQTSTVEVTIQSVTPEAKEITVVYKAGTAEKTIKLGVSRKAEITVNGKKVDLGSLGSGLKASIEYDKGLEIVTRIVATGNALGAPELLEVSELNPGTFPWLSDDGLTIYWRGEDGIYTATRSNPNALFANKRLLLTLSAGGGMPTLSQDGLYMVLWIEGVFHSTTRPSVEEPFERPRQIREFLDQDRPWNPCLSPDGLTIYFNRRRLEPDGSRPYEFAFSKRSSRNEPWSKPEPLPIQRDGIEGNLQKLYVTADGCSLYCTHLARENKFEKGNLMVWWRATTKEPFAEHRYIEIKGLPPLAGECPRYVLATNELFFERSYPKDSGKKAGIWVVKNFVPPTRANK